MAISRNTGREEDKEEYKRFFLQGEKDWGVMKGEDVNLDLNYPKMRVMVPAAKQERWLVTSGCGTCDGKSIMMYEDESRYLQEHLPFRCRHSETVSGISEAEGGEAEETATRMPQLVARGVSGNGD